ncbi:MAG: ribbon-helix-helix protein, CopG family [Alphaproteobacteria bacterium]|nr:MAG: ribbon-helix-helix protein, CopG family [Alphaproteobacteria bacterium]
MRTIVTIPEDLAARLDAVARRRGISRAEAIRHAIRIYLSSEAKEQRSMFGAWRGRGIRDGLEWQRRLREEWDD